MTKPNAILTVAAPGDEVDGVDIGHVDHPMPTLEQPGIRAWMDANWNPDDGDWLAVDVDLDGPATYDVSGWPHMMVTLTGEEIAAVRTAQGVEEK